MVEPAVHGSVALGSLVPRAVDGVVLILDLASLEVQVVGGHILAAFAVLAHRNQAAIVILDQGKLAAGLDDGVRVAAHHEVDVVAVLDDVDIIGLAGVVGGVADVRDHHHIVDLLHLLEILGRGVGHIDRGQIAHALIVLEADEPLGLHIDAHEGHALVAIALDDVGLEHALERSAAHLVVGAELLGVDVAVVLGNLVHAVVKLVVAQDDHVIAQRVHQGILHLAAIEREEDRALHGIASVDGDGVGVLAADVVVDGTATQHAAQAVAGGLNLAVRVVGGNDDQVLGLHRSKP